MEINLGGQRTEQLKDLQKQQNFCTANAIKRFASREQTENV